MLVYAPRITPRIEFTFNLVLKEWLGIDYRLTSCHYLLEDSLESKLCYSPKQVANAFWVKPNGLLLEKDIHELILETEGTGADLVLFPEHDKSSFSFDIFSAIFYLVSRYEEYLPFEPDEHGRFPSAMSFVVKSSIQDIPIVDVWVQQFSDALRQKFPFLSLSRNTWGGTIHIDIDNAFAHKGKGMIRTGGKLALALGQLRLKDFTEVAGSSLCLAHDPFDTYNAIQQEVVAEDISLKWFLHVGNLSKFDRPVNWRSRVFKRLAGKLSRSGNIGIHPSYGVLDDPDLLHQEVERFTCLAGAKPTFSRFHFLRFRFPTSYRMLMNEGITADFSMGFSDRVGYRAGTTRPFSFFDLTTNTEEEFAIYPFVAMDSALNFQLKMNPLEAIEEIDRLHAIQQNTGGDFSIVFHNEILSDKVPWNNWGVLFKEVVGLMKGEKGER
ncbi:MAG TPA: hypothetical protein VMW01_14890 [Williamwhitmania sp.]|nr:hypothetical protein [Williamwhitmania sp.]